MTKCKLGVSFGYASTLYSFPGHPLNKTRTDLFGSSIKQEGVSIVKPVPASEEDLLLFHSQEYVDFVKESSKNGEGFLDYGDTPSFKGVYEASLYAVGSTLNGLDLIVSGEYDHFFNPVGGLHHARRDRAGGFCVFNDSAIAIQKALSKLNFKRVAYVDIDAHHGDGVFYGYESDERVIIGDIHEDGRYIYPGTGFPNETGKGRANGTKLNLPLAPSSGDNEFISSFDKLEGFISSFQPEFVFFQCGADGLSGDPLTHLQYSAHAHSYAAGKLHSLAHDTCNGHILAMGGGGYNPRNVEAAWIAVARALSGK
ncbi:MAG: acetoin utilization protein AcuC [Nitrososphaerales archaeon]